MISIDIKELKKFLAAARNIKDRNILPILAYVKLECKEGVATITKTNLDSFVTCTIDASFEGDTTILIDEKTLSSTVAYSTSNIITISVKDNNVIMDDGVRKNRCATQDSKLFPRIEGNKDLQKYSLSADVLSSLSIAKQHTFQSNEKNQWECYVHVIKGDKKTLIGAANGFVLYLKMFTDNIPSMVLSPDTVYAVAGLPYADYSSSERYDFFESVDVAYGFIKPLSARPGLGFIWDKLVSENSFTVSRKELIQFCEMVISMNGSSIVPEVYIKDDGSDITLLFDGPSDAQGAKQNIKAKGKSSSFPETRFQPKNLIVAMKDLGVDTVNLTKISGNVLITSDEDKDYKGSIMELAPLN